MAASTSPNQPAYLSPLLGRNHSRRGSTRRSFSSSLVESPRTLCPRDGDAFSYNPSHLADWYIPQDLWDRLPPKLQTTLAAMQHGGAAVLTGFERLEKHIKHLESGHPIHKLREEELMGQLALPPPKLRTNSDASSASFSDTSSSVFTDTSNSGCTSPSVSGSQDASPVSPMCLSPFDPQCHEKRERTRERSFSTPREAHDAYFAAELSHLRTEALTRLRHTARKVDQEWSEAKRTNAVFPGDIKDFEDWWGKKKSTITYLNEKGKRMSLAIGLSSSGMGWTYAP